MNLKSYMATLQLVMIIWQGRSSYETLSLADADWHRLRQYSRQMEKLSDEVGEVADEVGNERFSESGVVSKASGWRADETTYKTDQRRTNEHNHERHHALHYVDRHDVVQSNLTELLEHPVQHLATTSSHIWQTIEIDWPVSIVFEIELK